jgi:hypothetical protein
MFYQPIQVNCAPVLALSRRGAELQAPSPHALVGDAHATLGQDQLDIAEAQAEHVVQPYRVVYQLGRKAVAIVRVGWLLHPTSVAEVAGARQLA